MQTGEPVRIPYKVINSFIYQGEIWLTLLVGTRLIERRAEDLARRKRR